MFYRGMGQIGDYCGRIFGHRSYMFNSPWVSLIVGALVVVLVVVLAVALFKTLNKKKNSTNDDLLELLKSKYVAGEIDEEEYLRKKKLINK